MAPKEMLQRARYLREFRVFEFNVGRETIPLILAPGIYEPDQYWSKTFLEGVTTALQKRKDRQAILEVGVGSGALPIYLHRRLPTRVRQFFGVDINPVACEIARLNMGLNRCVMATTFHGGASLLNELSSREKGKFDVILANLPQIPLRRTTVQNLNDFYPIDDKNHHSSPGLYRVTGLGLLEELLEQAPHFLAVGGAVVFTFSGRCGDDAKNKFLSQFGVRFLMSRRIPQDSKTPIDYFADVETAYGLHFNFYRSLTSKERISGTEASQLQKIGQTVFHDLSVAVWPA